MNGGTKQKKMAANYRTLVPKGLITVSLISDLHKKGGKKSVQNALIRTGSDLAFDLLFDVRRNG